jgi:hypothetical protein
MKQIHGEEDSVLIWGDLYGTRGHFVTLLVKAG